MPTQAELDKNQTRAPMAERMDFDARARFHSQPAIDQRNELRRIEREEFEGSWKDNNTGEAFILTASGLSSAQTLELNYVKDDNTVGTATFYVSES